VALAAGLVRRLLVDDAERSVLWIRRSGASVP
jgi:hypothetical protein